MYPRSTVFLSSSFNNSILTACPPKAGIIRLNFDSRSPWPCVSTNLDTFEILASYRDTRHSKLAEKHLANQRLFGNQSQA